jgi:UDP-2,4-diacetamido-2,4,6-trideoxy-beta-L-altropyranose hydrolase
MRVALRVDASREIGIGHFMRTLTLADELRASGAATRFISRHLPESLRSLLGSKGHELALLASDSEPVDELPHARFLGTSQQCDARDTLAALAGRRWDWLVVDHYGLDSRWESVVRGAARRIMAIDDVADRDHDSDLLLDQNLYAGMSARYEGRVPPGCRTMLGPSYALLRPEFRLLREAASPRANAVRRVLVFFGGGDPHDFTGHAVAALARLGSRRLEVDVVIGSENRRCEQIEAQCRAGGFDCHVQTAKMAELMAAADLAAGAGGSASWERCCVGLPAVCVAFAQNQVDIARALDDAGACWYVGGVETATESRIEQALRSLMEDDARRVRMSATAFGLVDGRGAERVLRALGEQ